MSDAIKDSVIPQTPDGRFHPRRFPGSPRRVDTGVFARKWLDLTFGSASASQKLDIYLPENGDGPFPVIVVLHGGGFFGGDKGEEQVLPMLSGLKRGYAVAPVNYRLSGEAIFPAAVQDCRSAVRYLRANAGKYCLDPDRIAAWGASAGAYMAAMLGTAASVKEFDDPEDDQNVSCAVQAVVDWCGPAEAFLKMDDEFIHSGHGFATHSAADSPESRFMGRHINGIPDLVRKASPMSHITRDIPPFLIQHGELDHIVPVEQSIAFADAIRRIAGDEEATLEVLKGVDHHGDPAFETAGNLQRVFRFLDDHLKK